MGARKGEADRHHAVVPTLTLRTPEGIELRTELAGVGSRLAAGALDLVLIIAGYLVLILFTLLGGYLLGEVGGDVLESSSDFLVGFLAGGIFLLIPAYLLAVHSLMNGTSPGKRMVGLRVVSASGYPASFGQHVLRSVIWLVDVVLMVPVSIGVILIAATPRGQRLGDLAAGTLVLREPRRTSAEVLWPDESWTTREPKQLDLTPGMAAKLSEEDVLLMRDSITRREMPRQLREKLYRDLVQHYAQRLGFTPAENTRTSLKELYLFARELRQG
jgi:uncharacterized RDD family membrane protein YckC